MRKITFLVPIFLFFCQTGNAQILSKTDLIFGYGFYEGYNIGGEYRFKQNKQSVSLSIGCDRLIKQESLALTLSYNCAIFRKSKSKTEQFRWRLNNKAVLWQLEDKYYLWRAVSLVPSINRRIVLNEKIKMSIDVGPSFNIALYNKRKTYEEVGWPYHIMPNFRILFIV